MNNHNNNNNDNNNNNNNEHDNDNNIRPLEVAEPLQRRYCKNQYKGSGTLALKSTENPMQIKRNTVFYSGTLISILWVPFTNHEYFPKHS